MNDVATVIAWLTISEYYRLWEWIYEENTIKRNVNSVLLKYGMCGSREATCPRLATRGFILWREAVLLNLVSCIKTERWELMALMRGEEKKAVWMNR